MGTIKTTNIETITGSGTLTLGQSGETISVPSGATLTVPSGGLSGQNYPMFQVCLSSSQSISNNVVTKIQFDTVDYDTASCWDAVNYRFTPNVAGKYVFYKNISPDNSNGVWYMSSEIQKNGAILTTGRIVNINANQSTADNSLETVNQFASGVVDMNGTTDYVEAFGYLYNTASGNQITGTRRTMFGGYRIGA
jgi:hypothetical protein